MPAATDDPNDPRYRRLQCTYCNKRFRDEADRRKHERARHAKRRKRDAALIGEAPPSHQLAHALQNAIAAEETVP